MSQFEPISGKKLKVFLKAVFFQTPLYFIETEDNIYSTLNNYYTFKISDNIQLSFFYILINIKYSNYGRISKNQKY
jgi:hypothetical protein